MECRRERCVRCASTDPTTRRRPTLPTLLSCCIALTLVIRGCGGECEFPAEWRGDWFQKGEPEPIRIGRTNISTKGICKEAHDKKFLVEVPNTNCLKCIGIGAKHDNVLQYKETPFCSAHRTHEAVCREFTGDALLYSLFRLGGSPVPCPFRGPLSFEYSQGHGQCSQPASSVEACTDPARLLLRFQACADVQGSESREEQLTCLGSWKEGSLRYLVGKLDHKAAKTDEDKFRCFVYEKTDSPRETPVAQSGDATCDGLTSPWEGSRTMLLRPGWASRQEPCAWPEWLSQGRRWRTLGGDTLYELGNLTLDVRGPRGDLDLTMRCHALGPSQEGRAQLLVHATRGCDSSYRCMRLYRRASHIVEMQLGRSSSDQSEACSSSHFDSSRAELVTLLREQPGAEPERSLCPLAGTFLLEGPQLPRLAWDAPSGPDQDCPQRSQLSSGCAGADRLELLFDCSPHKRLRSFQCHGSWEENGTHFVIASAMHNQRRYCIAFSENGRLVHFAESPQACVHGGPWPLKEPAFAFNLTSTGECQEGNGAKVHSPLFLRTALVVVSGLWWHLRCRQYL